MNVGQKYKVLEERLKSKKNKLSHLNENFFNAIEEEATKKEITKLKHQIAKLRREYPEVLI